VQEGGGRHESGEQEDRCDLPVKETRKQRVGDRPWYETECGLCAEPNPLGVKDNGMHLLGGIEELRQPLPTWGSRKREFVRVESQGPAQGGDERPGGVGGEARNGQGVGVEGHGDSGGEGVVAAVGVGKVSEVARRGSQVHAHPELLREEPQEGAA
jgi:hypothetical protein